MAWPRLERVVARQPANVRAGVAVRLLGSAAAFAHRAGEVFPAASTVKLLILGALARAVDSGSLRLDDRVPILPSQRVGGSGVLQALETPMELSLRDHAWLMIAISDNTASNVLIDAVGMDAIARLQESLGLNCTALNRRFLGRLPDPGNPDNTACASDLVEVLAATHAGTIASAAMSAWMLAVLGDQQVTDRLARHLPEPVRFAGKSGWLEGLSHDAGLLRGPGGTLVMAVLTEGYLDRYRAAEFIGEAGRAAVEDAGIAQARTTP
jgi:beta-lactamase class A